MTAIIEEEEITVEADEWRSVVGMKLKEDTLAALVDEYLAQGGQITVVEPGQTTGIIQQHYSAFNKTDQSYELIQRKKRRMEDKDAKLVPEVDKILDRYTELTRTEMRKLLGLSSYTFTRILNTYFRQDPRHLKIDEAFLHRRALDQVERVKKAMAEGVTGRDAVAKAAGIGSHTLYRLIQDGMVWVPKSKTCCQR